MKLYLFIARSELVSADSNLIFMLTFFVPSSYYNYFFIFRNRITNHHCTIRPMLNGLMLLISAGFSGGTIALWLELASHFEEVAKVHLAEEEGLGLSMIETRFKIGMGFMFLVAGCGTVSQINI